MCRFIFCVLLSCILQYAVGFRQHQSQLCGNNTTRSARSCTTQILGNDNAGINTCHVEYYPANSNSCKAMNFGPISSHTYIGGVSLKPHLLPYKIDAFSTVNFAVLNITFSNIKWKTMKFRFQTMKQKNFENHCRDITLSNDVTINDRSVLYYDCYWTGMDQNYNGQSHILDFEATDDREVNRGQYYFNIPSVQMLSPTVTEREWLPFLYIEILPGTMKLHIMPPPPHLNVTGYEIKVMKEANKGTEIENIKILRLKNHTHVVTYDWSLLNNGSYYFVVSPLHAGCQSGGDGCPGVESPRIVISREVQSMKICIASIFALFVTALFAYYMALKAIRKYWCKDYALTLVNEIPPPTKVLVVYSPANRLHAECVASFVTYLRAEYGFDVMYDADIALTQHRNPLIWAEDAFNLASHVLYVVGPKEPNLCNNIYDRPITTAHKDVDKLLLNRIAPNSTLDCRKDVANVFFEHSDGEIPIETRHEKVFFILKDWQKLIAHLSKNLLPRKQIMRTERGKCFLDDLSRAKKLLSGKHDDVIIRCDKGNVCEKKILI